MKQILFSMILLADVLVASAQVSAIDGMMQYQKGHNKQSSVVELPYPPEIVENAIKESMAKKGIKGQRSKDIQIYRGVKLNNDDEYSDLHFKVERKSRKEKDVSIVYLIVARSNENVALRADNDVHKSEGGKAFLNDLAPSVAAHDLNVSIKAQEEVIAKAEKKLKKYESDQQEYEKRIKDLEDKLEQNKKDQEAQTLEIDKQRSIRDAMNARRVQ